MKKFLTLLFSISLLSACADKGGASGRIGDQIKGKKLSVQAFYLKSTKSPTEMPSVNVTNDSDQNFAMMPVKITAWFKQAGKKEMTLNAGELAGDGQIAPHKVAMLPDSIFKFDVAPSDQLDRLRLSLGLDGSSQEVFTITP